MSDPTKEEMDAAVERSEDLILNGPRTETLHGTPIGQHEEIDPSTGMQKDYVVLSAAERAKGFVRPVYRAYKHVGKRPKYPLRDLTPEEAERYKAYDYVKYEEYPKGEPGPTGCYWTKAGLKSGCGAVTTMGLTLCETFARQPNFYGSTFCSTCGTHIRVGEHGEFVWMDGGRETTIKVGT